MIDADIAFAFDFLYDLDTWAIMTTVLVCIYWPG